MSVDLYEASVPIFLRYIDRLNRLINLAESHIQHHNLDPSEILDARLAGDMLPFEKQIHIATHFAPRTCFPLIGQSIPDYGEFPATFEGLKLRIATVTELLASLERSQFQNAEQRIIHSTAGKATLELPATIFLLQYSLPNFFFHITTTYTILRQQGLAIGKADFDGFHLY
jgi:uncharacterized protein